MLNCDGLRLTDLLVLSLSSLVNVTSGCSTLCIAFSLLSNSQFDMFVRKHEMSENALTGGKPSGSSDILNDWQTIVVNC